MSCFAGLVKVLLIKAPDGTQNLLEYIIEIIIFHKFKGSFNVA